MLPVQRGLPGGRRRAGPLRVAPRSRHPLLLPAAVVAVGAALVILITPAAAPNNSDPSSYATGRSGTWALYHLEASLGAVPTRVTGSGFGGALQPADTLVEAAPTVSFTKAQVVDLLRFVRLGGTLLYAVGSAAVDAPILAALGLTTSGAYPAGRWREAFPLAGHAPLLVEMGPAVGLRYSGATALPLLGPVSAPVAVVEQLGRGRAVVLGSEAPISNAGLRQSQNGLFAVLASGTRPGRQVVFDEIHHGYSLGDGAAALLLGTPLGLAAILVAVVVMLFLASRGRRLGRALPPPELVSVRTTEEQLDALAHLYARTSDRRAVAGRYLAELKASAGPELGRTPGGRGTLLASELNRLLGDLEAASRLAVEPKRLTELARRADSLERRLAGAAPAPISPEVIER